MVTSWPVIIRLFDHGLQAAPSRRPGVPETAVPSAGGQDSEDAAFERLRLGRSANHQMLMMVPTTPTPAATPLAFFPGLTTKTLQGATTP
jgi:hypothetical protein